MFEWHSLTIDNVKFVTDSLLKNNGINTSFLVSICIGKSMDSGQPIFHKKITRDEVMKLEKAFLEMTYVTDECVEVYDFLKLYFRVCTNKNNQVPVRPWFDDLVEEEQWGCGYRVDLVAQFEQNFLNKNFVPQDQGKDDPIDTLDNRTKFRLNIISNAQGPVLDILYDYDYNDEGLDNSVSGAKIFPEIAELKIYWVYWDVNESENN